MISCDHSLALTEFAYMGTVQSSVLVADVPSQALTVFFYFLLFPHWNWAVQLFQAGNDKIKTSLVNCWGMTIFNWKCIYKIGDLLKTLRPGLGQHGGIHRDLCHVKISPGSPSQVTQGLRGAPPTSIRIRWDVKKIKVCTLNTNATL